MSIEGKHVAMPTYVPVSLVGFPFDFWERHAASATPMVAGRDDGGLVPASIRVTPLPPALNVEGECPRAIDVDDPRRAR